MKNPACFLFIFIFFSTAAFCQTDEKPIIPGADRMPLYMPATRNRTVALVANHTSLVGHTNLLDTLLSRGVKVKKVFCPEHGFRGTSGAGETVRNGRDIKTGIPIVSLYGKKLKPSPEDLAGIDVVIYDLQDVGVRFYTYISTMYYVMQACAENFIPLFILDRPNPNGFYVDGPVLDMKYKSFAGIVPIPVVYGMTPGELANMMNDEGWLKTAERCSIGVIPCYNYTHKSLYRLPVNPSPNLQNMKAVYLYPSIGLFEGTAVNVGRGTDFPFQVFGSPRFPDTLFKYTPHTIPGVVTNPPNANQVCYGVDLQNLSEEELTSSARLNLDYVIQAYRLYPDKAHFFNSYFENLIGTDKVRLLIKSGVGADEIRARWETDLKNFKALRKKYLMYEDFE